ncbi:hypothetical protein M2226_003631 [Bradyrhizobium elkanii]|nr:hypothetical protein [Bradyrhizobium elkanii]MCW2171633.1 hypothetical protein [Bradyrhizobium elkanii]
MNQKSSLRKIPLFVSQALTANNDAHDAEYDGQA